MTAAHEMGGNILSALIKLIIFPRQCLTAVRPANAEVFDGQVEFVWRLV